MIAKSDPPVDGSGEQQRPRKRRLLRLRRRRRAGRRRRRAPLPFDLRKALFILPNAFTVSSIFCGLYAILLATSERDDKDRADPTYRQAIQVVLGAGKGSVSLIQRKLQIGYSRAARLLDLMAEDGIVGPARGSKPREINTTLEEWEGSQAA